LSTLIERRRGRDGRVDIVRSQRASPVHNRRVTDEHLELIERTRRLLKEHDLPCTIAGPATDAAIEAAEETLGVALPPSYRAFLKAVGGLTLPHRASTIHHFIGLADHGPGKSGGGVVERTSTARVENRLGRNLVIAAIGAEPGEWFCIDVDRVGADGECPIFLFDARDNALDQQFYDDFGALVTEALTFVLENLDAGDLDVGADASGETSLGGAY
jgi:hypothetical protein